MNISSDNYISRQIISFGRSSGGGQGGIGPTGPMGAASNTGSTGPTGNSGQILGLELQEGTVV